MLPMLGALLALLAAALPAEGQQVSPDTSTRFAQALKKLGSDDYQEREAASAEIAALPAEALRLVEAALKEPGLELEVRARLERTIPRFREKARRETVAKKKASYEAWTRRTISEAYEKGGRKDPKWDAKALEGLRLVDRVWADAGSPNDERRVYALCDEAIRAGCDDPMVIYVRARMYDNVVRKDFRESAQFHLDAAKALKERGAAYPPIRHAFSFARVAEITTRVDKTVPDAKRAETALWLNLSLDRLGSAAEDPEVPDSSLEECGDILVSVWLKMTGDRKVGFEKVNDVFQRKRPDGVLPLIFKGDFNINYAWDARGSGYANTVTPDGWKLMGQRLAEAETALTAAWKKDPSDARAATLMIGVELGTGKGRPSMEAWFKRAMDADPDNVEACRKKMYYLEPKWHGSAEAMLAFGRELLAGGNWEARLPFQLIDAHLTLAGYEEDETKYYRKDGVWKDVKSVYDPYLKLHPDNAFDRTWLAKLACWCGQYGEANRLFQQLGDKVDPSVFTDRAEMDKLKAEAAQKAR